MSWLWQEAQEQMAVSAAAQERAEQEVRDCAETAAQAERNYRVALHKRIVQLRGEGTAATACESLAKGEPEIAELRYLRDVADGVLVAAKAALYRRRDDRADTLQLARWSQAREMADGSIGGDSRLSFSGGRAA